MIPQRAAGALVLAVALTAGASGAEPRLTVSSAVSLKEPLSEFVRDFADGRCRVEDIQLHLGGSSVLAQQLLRGAPADVFLSASPWEMRRLAEAGLVDAGRICTFAGNRLMIVVAAETEPPQHFLELSDLRFSRIGVANPRTAPLGRYTAQALDASGMSADLAARLIPAEHARQVIDYVVRGEVDAAIVYATDAATYADRLGAALMIDDGLHEPIVYQAAMLRGAPNRASLARVFVERLCSDRGRTVFEGHGFSRWSGPR